MTSIKQNLSPIRMRNYGRILQDMVSYACRIEDESQRKALTLYIAQCMRQKNVVWNKDQDAGLKRVKDDIALLSNNLLNCDFPEFDNLPAARVANQPQQQKKKKK